MAFPTAKLSDFGKVQATHYAQLWSEESQLVRLRKLYCYKHELPRVPAHQIEGIDTKKRLPKWYDVQRT